MLIQLITYILTGIFLLLSLISCTEKTQSPKDTLVIGITSYPNTLDPRFATDANGQRICNLIFSSIVRLGPELKVVGDLAETWDYKNLTYTFQLKSNIKFHDGSNLTKEDLLFSFEEYKKSNSPFNFVTQNIENIEAEYNNDHRFIKIKLKTYSSVFLTDLSPLKILPKNIVSKVGEAFSQNPIGTGSFIFTSKDTNKINLKKNELYFSSIPKMDKVQFSIVKDANTLYLKLFKGHIDIVQSDLPKTKISFLEKNPNFNVYKSVSANMTYLLVNLKNEILSHLPVRKALFQSLNRKEIIKYKLEDLAQEASSILPPNNPFHLEQKNSSFNLEEAKKNIKPYLPFKSSLILKTSNDKVAMENGKVLVYQLKQLGIPVELRSFEWGTFYGDLKNGNFDLATMKWVGATDPDIYRIALHSKELPPGRNRGFYKNTELDKMLDAGIQIEDYEQRIKHYKLVQEIVFKDLPFIPLWYDFQVAAVSTRIEDYKMPLNGDFSFTNWVIKK